MSFIRTQNTIEIVDLPLHPSIQQTLDNGLYKLTVQKTVMGLSFNLHILEKFILPEKLYGNVEDKTNHILTAYKQSKHNMGVLLEGISGNGKTLQAKHLCNTLSKEYPVIVLSDDSIKNLDRLIDLITQPVVFFCDEFEKQFENSEEQNFLLTLLDGTSATSNLYILTSNNRYKINSFMLNRPSRIRYYLRYGVLDKSAIKEILEDKLINKDKYEEILNLVYQVQKLSYDNLISFVEECNMFPSKDPKDLLKMFNITKTNPEDDYEYEIKIYDSNEKLIENNLLKLSDFNIRSMFKTNFFSNAYLYVYNYNGDYLDGATFNIKSIKRDYELNTILLTIGKDSFGTAFHMLSESIKNKLEHSKSLEDREVNHLKKLYDDITSIHNIKFEIKMNYYHNDNDF